MDSRNTSSFLFLFSFSLLFSIGAPFDLYTSCSNRFDCGHITGVGFPFWGNRRPAGCGHPALQLTCQNNTTATMIMKKVKYNILNLHNTTLTIARADYTDDLCPNTFINTTIDHRLFDMIAPDHRNITLLYCSSSPVAGQFRCPGYEFGFIQAPPLGPGRCNATVVVPVSLGSFPPVSDLVNATEMLKAINEGFEVKLKDEFGCGVCEAAEGVCGYDLNSNHTICYCRDGARGGSGACGGSSGAPAPAASPAGGNDSKETHRIIGLFVGGATVLTLCIGCCVLCFRLGKKKHFLKLKSIDHPLPPPPSSSAGGPTRTMFLSDMIVPSYAYSRSDLNNGSSYFGAQVFTYFKLQEATHNFDPSRELGDGGYSTVYYGTLKDGRIVSVKRLYENNYKRVEQFMNEVEILSRLQHPNLVKLYGCTSRHSRELLLVYEYIPNGTVADHLHGNRTNSGLLSWSVRLKIAIETANALAYLHRKDIIHRDVKTNNILLDNNYKVKVADFGLSRLFPIDVTHVSTAPQGTLGYVDPEYHQCYQLTEKSDVYSFGVVLVELISSMEAVDINRNRNDINLSNMAIDRIQKHALGDLVDPDLGFDRDYAVRCTITSVSKLAFRCLRPESRLRPCMDEVVEVLRKIESEELGARKAEVLDLSSDNVRLLRNASSQLSPDSGPVTDKWMKVLNRST